MNADANGIAVPKDKVVVGLSDAFKNKSCLTTDSAYGDSFKARAVTLADLAHHITAGKAWTQGNFGDKPRRKEYFQSAQTLALDLDQDVSIEQAFAEKAIADYAFLIHATPSSTAEHPKTRVVFCLSEPITVLSIWETLQRALLARFAHLHPDPACKDATRLFYGSDQPGALVWPDARLPIAAIARYTVYEALDDDQWRELSKVAPAGVPDSDRAAKYAAKALEMIAGRVASAAAGERNVVLNREAYVLFGMAKAGDWPGITEPIAEQQLVAMAYRAGLPEVEIERTVASAKRAAIPDSIVGRMRAYTNGSNGHNATAPIPDKPLDPLAVIAKETQELAKLRRNGGDVQVIVSRLRKELDALQAGQGEPESEGIVSMTVPDFEAMNTARTAGKHSAMLRTGLADLDRLLGGLRRGLYTLYGDVSMGKSTLLATIAASLMTQAPGLLITTESFPMQWLRKVTAYRARVPYDKIEDSWLMNDKEYQRVKIAIGEMNKTPTRLMMTAAPTPEQIAATVKRDVEQHSIQWVILDSVSNVKPYGGTLYEDTRRTSKAMQAIVRSHPIVFIQSVQIGRNVKFRANKRPTIYDAKGGQDIEQDSDVILSLYNHDYYVSRQMAEADSYTPPGVALVTVEKHRWRSCAGQSTRLQFIGGIGYYSYRPETIKA